MLVAILATAFAYQGAHGGPTYCPLDRDARIVVSSTPKFARTVAHKYAEVSSARLREDLQQNHGRSISRGLARDIAALDEYGTVRKARPVRLRAAV